VDLESILAERRSERARTDHAIAALEGLAGPSAPRRGRPPQVTNCTGTMPETAHDEPCSPQANLGSDETALGEVEG
jgi:hypothetical protein